MKLEIEKIPKKITPCPITEAVVELRFESEVPADLVSALIYNGVRTFFPSLEKLPVMELPAAIRDSDPNLRFSPHYKASNKDFTLQIGPRSFSVFCPKEYKGWNQFFDQITSVYNVINQLSVINKPIRIGLRYISFFEKINIFEKIKIELNLASISLINENNVLRTEFNQKEFKHTLQIANGALFNNRVKGSSIDIDVSKEGSPIVLSDFLKLVEQAHEAEKQLFFGILKDDFLKEFNPEF